MKKGMITLGALLVVASTHSYQTKINNKTPYRLEVTLKYTRGVCKRKQDKFLVDAGKTKTFKHKGLCCLKSFEYVVRSGPKSGTKYFGQPVPTRLMPNPRSCRNNHFVIKHLPEDNSLYFEDTFDKGEKGYYLYVDNKSSQKVKVSVGYSTADCPSDFKVVDAGKTMFMNTGSVRAGVYLGKAKPTKSKCCIKKVSMSPVQGAQAGKWFEFVPSREKSLLYGGHCAALKLKITENPDESLFIEAQ